MKKLILILAIVAISHSIVFSQGCLPEGIVFGNQQMIDDFPSNYPGCTIIEGDVGISGNNIAELNGLFGVTTIMGSLTISGNEILSDLSGLNNLTTVAGEIDIQFNIALVNLIGLEGIVSTGNNLGIHHNLALSSLEGLSNLNYVNGSLWIGDNISLTNLSDLINLSIIGGNIYIVDNKALKSLSGLDNIDANSIENLDIQSNDSLCICDVQSVCEYLQSPNGEFYIMQNSTGCNSPEEVELSCLTSVEENATTNEITLFPNPATSFISINTKEGAAIEEAIIYNHLGQKALVAKPANNLVDVSKLQQGVYIIELTTKDWKERRKLIIE